MKNEDLTFTFKNIGPIKKKGSIKNSNITILYGRPNSGKSFILRSLYSTLSVLDLKMRDLMKVYCQTYLNDLLISHIGNSLNNLAKTFNDVLEIMDRVSNVVNKEKIPLNNQESLNKVLFGTINEIIPELNLENSGDGLSYTISEEITIPISIESINKNLENTIVRFISSIIGVRSIKSFNINDDNLYNILKTEIGNLTYDSIAGKFGSSGMLYLTPRIQDSFKMSVEYSMLAVSSVNIKVKVTANILLRNTFVGPIDKNAKVHHKDEINLNQLTKSIVSQVRNVKISKYSLFEIREISKAFSKSISMAMVDYFLAHMHSLIEFSSSISEVRFVPFGKTPLIISHRYFKNYNIFENNDLLYDSTEYIYRAFIDWIDFSEKMVSIEKDFPFDTSTVLQGNLSYDELTKRLFYTDNMNVKVDLKYASAMASEVSGILLLAKSMKNGLLIIEEPESQLHPSSQVIMALTLIVLSSMGKRIVFSTHSSIIGQVFYLLHKYKPNPEKIQTLIDNVMNVERKGSDKIEISDLAKQVSKSLQECEFDSYFVDRIKGVKKINLEEFENGIPGITDEVLMKLLDWTVTLVEGTE